MSYIREFINWCQIWKDEASDTLIAFLLFLAGVVIYEANPLFMIIPFFLFFLTQYFHYLCVTEYDSKFYKLTKEERDTFEMLDNISTIIPKISYISGSIFIVILAIAYFF